MTFGKRSVGCPNGTHPIFGDPASLEVRSHGRRWNVKTETHVTSQPHVGRASYS